MTINKLYLFLIVVATSLTLQCNASPNVVSSEYQINSLDILGSRATFALINITYDEEVYVADTIQCGPNSNAATNWVCDPTPVSEYDCPPCDYTNVHGRCGVPAKEGCTCPLSHLCDQNSPAPENQWIDLAVNTTITFNTGEGQKNNYIRFYNDQPCNGFKIRLQSKGDGVRASFSFDEPIVEYTPYPPYPDRGAPVYYYPQEISYCPDGADYGQFRVGTLFITLISINIDTLVELSVVSIPIPTHPPTRTTTIIAAYDESVLQHPNIIPVYDGINVDGYSEDPVLYAFFIDKCEVISVRATLNSSGDVDMDAAYTPDYEYPIFSFTRFGEEYLTISLCPEEGHATRALYINVIPIGGFAQFRLIVHTGAPRILLPVSSGLAFSQFYVLQGSVMLDVPTQPVPPPFCPDFFYLCTGFYGIYPGKNPNIFNPLPYFLANVVPSDLAGIRYSQAFDVVPAERTIQAVAVLQYSSEGNFGSPVNQALLDQSRVNFTGFLVGSDFLPLKGGVSLTKAPPRCEFDEFSRVKSNISALLEQVQSAENELVIRQYRFNVDSFLQFNAWSNCQDMIKTFVEINEEPVLTMTADCLSDTTSEEWANDPCCNKVLGWSQCCMPTLKTQISPVFTGVTDNAVLDRQCASASCSADIAADYARTFTNIDNCNSPGQLFNSEKEKMVYIMRSCSEQTLLPTVFCTDDVTCTTNSNGATITGAYCDLTNHVCAYPPDYKDTEYMKCIVQSLRGAVLIQLQTSLGLPVDVSADSLVSALRSSTQTPDCLPIYTGYKGGANSGIADIEARRHFTLDDSISPCPPELGCGTVLCKDQMCDTPMLTACDTLCYRSWVYEESTPETCVADLFCSWKDCTGLSPEACTAECDTGPATYCGVCLNPIYCPEVIVPNGLTCADLASGNGGHSCLSPGGTFSVVASESDCTNHGSCTIPCGMCVSGVTAATGVCYYENITPDACNTTYNGEYDNTLQLCVVADSTQSACAAPGLWATCTSYDRDTCITIEAEPQTAAILQYLQCKWDRSVQCTSRTACEAERGRCSDAEYIPAIGACLLPHRSDFSSTELAFCADPLITAPNGCVDITLDRPSCEAQGHVWYTPKFTADECINVKGCYEIVTPVLDVQNMRMFTSKDINNCTACNDADNTEWRSYYSWETAHWIPGKIVAPSIKTKVLDSKHHWVSATDYVAVQDKLLQIVANLTTTAYQIEAYCIFNKLQDSLTNLVCDCTGTGQANSECYVNNPRTLDSLVRPCAGEDEATSYSTSTAQVTFPPAAVAKGCAEMLIYDISSKIFKGSQPVRLAAYFAPFQQQSLYAAKNDRGGTFGQVIGDGIVLETNVPVSQMELCVTINHPTSNSDFKIYDFADSAGDYSFVVPREISAYVRDQKICAVVDLPVGQTVFIPVKIVEDWRSVGTTYFAQTTTQLLYALAAGYLAVAAFAFVQLVAVAIYKLLERDTRFQISTIITLALFIYPFIRCLYFFAVPTGMLSNGGAISEYVLIVFPTFPYFTAFSFVPIVWALLTSASLQRTSSGAGRLIALVGVINVVLYLLFMIIVIVFNYAKKIEYITCLGQTVAISSGQTTAQTAVSIVYSVVVAAVSLVLSVAFIYFGRKAAVIPQSGSAVMKTYRIAVVCSVGFGLNCIFIIIITAANLNSIAFSFVGLIITEIIPTMFMLWSFGSLGTLKKLFFGRSRSASSLGSLASLSASSHGSDENKN